MKHSVVIRIHVQTLENKSSKSRSTKIEQNTKKKYKQGRHKYFFKTVLEGPSVSKEENFTKRKILCFNALQPYFLTAKINNNNIVLHI